jgi:hypothetical protein
MKKYFIEYTHCIIDTDSLLYFLDRSCTIYFLDMKKILLSILFLALSFGSISENVFSADAGETTTMLNGTEIDNTNSNPDQSAAETARLNGQNGSTTTTTVIVTEKVPGVKCDPIDGTNAETPVEKRKYACTVKSGLAGFQ